jgi:signal transduction histidine kinase
MRLDEKTLQRRKGMVMATIALTVLLLVGFALAAWKYLKRMDAYLEEELATRLKSVAILTADLIETEGFVFDLAPERIELVSRSLEEMLTRVNLGHQLQGAYLIDPDFSVIASSRNLLPPETVFPFLGNDADSARFALSGQPAVGAMQIIVGNRFKSAFAPVNDPFGSTVALVVVQANAGFFELLQIFQRGLVLGGAAGVFIAVLFSLFLYWAIQLLIRTHESMRKTERLAAMGQMAATVAHEIRNPLSIIKGTADVLKSRFGGDSEDEELFDYIPSEVRRLNRLVSDFLAFARDRDVERNAVDLRATIDNTFTTLGDEIDAAGIELEIRNTELPDVRHDPDAINQVVLNLALNAIQAMEKGGRLQVSLEHTKHRGRSFVSVSMQDTGCGFEVNAEQIFEPFFTTKTHGSGLGLAICKRIIEKHDGWIEARSEVGKGTRMTFFLPSSN